MRFDIDARLSSRIAIIVAMAGIWNAPAHAQQAATYTAAADTAAAAAQPSGGALEEIIVTARKRAENIQKTPVAITAFSAAQLDQHKIEKLEDMTGQVPGLTADESAAGPLTLQMSLRGQHTADYILELAPAVAVYVDDVYQGSTTGSNLANLDDLQSVEVLKGPQGTLYGRNTTGGAIKAYTKLPSYDGFSGMIDGGAGNYGSNQEAANVNLPIIDNKVAVRLSAQRIYHDGYGMSVNTGQPLNQLDSRSANGSLRLDPMDDLEIVVRGDWADGRDSGLVEDKAAITPGITAAVLDFGLGKGIINPADFAKGDAAFLTQATKAAAVYQTYLDPHSYNVFQDAHTGMEVRTAGGSINWTYKLNDDISIKSITAYRWKGALSAGDEDQTDVATLQGEGERLNVGQLTQEFQINGNSLDNKLKWVAGYYYFYETGSDDVHEIIVPHLNPLGQPTNYLNHIFDESNSLYGQGSYSLTSTVSATIGLRWTSETNDLETGNNTGVGANFSCAIPPALTPNGCSAIFRNTFHNISYLFGLDWQATDDLLFYAKTSKGFKAGGENQHGSISGGYVAFAPEILTDYEVGAKSEWFDRRLRADLALYHSDYSNIQRQVDLFQNNQIVPVVTNAASATIDGAELELTARPVDGLTLHGSAAYTSPRYEKYFNTALGVDLSHDAFQATSKWQFGASATYVMPVPYGHLSSTLDYSYKTKSNLYPDNNTIFSNGATIQPGFGLLNARIAYNIDDYDTEISFWIKNITDETYIITATDLTGSLGYAFNGLGDPRTFGFEVKKEF
jgi:iron complex outermembrane receptor protein